MTKAEQLDGGDSGRRRRALRVALALLVLVVCGATAWAQQQIRGQVVNRDRVPQQCQLTFYSGNNVIYRLTADRKGYFYITNPRYGSYRILITQGNRRAEVGATVNQRGLSPAPLIVPW